MAERYNVGAVHTYKHGRRLEPKLVKVGTNSAFTLQVRTDGARRVDPGCIDISKRDSYYKRKSKYELWKIIPVEGFLPAHDFQRDEKYLDLSRKLTYFDIELAKRVALGDTVREIRAQMLRGTSARGIPMYQVKTRVAKREAAIMPLVEYFRSLLGVHKDPETFSVEEAFRSMVLDVRNAKAGKERFDLTARFVEMCGMGKKLAEYGRSRIGDLDADTGPNLKQMQAMAGNGSQT